MSKKKGMEDGSVQQGTGGLGTRSAKEKGNQAATKLERFAHTPNQTPNKSSNLGGGQQQVGHPGRRSQTQENGTLVIPSSVIPLVGSASRGTLDKQQNLGLEGATGGDQGSSGEREPSLQDILTAVNTCKQSITELSEQFKSIRDELLVVKGEVRTVCTRTTALEERFSQMEDDVYPLKQEVALMKIQLRDCLQKMDSMENRLRRENLRVLGLPEGCEGNNPIQFMEDWLREKFGRDSFSATFAVERAHRIGPKTPAPGGHPRPFIFKLLCFRDKVTILQKARELRNIQHNGARISLYPDFSPELQRQRAKFGDCKHKLQQLRINYALLFPAQLRVSALGEVRFFSTPKEVSTWLESIEERIKRGEGS